VGDHDDGGAALVEIGQQLHHLVAVRGVQVAGGLVRQDQLGTAHHRPAHGHPLLLPPRQLLREMVLARHELHLLQHRQHPFLPGRGRDAEIEQRQLHILKHRQLVDEVEALEDEADIRFAELGPPALGVAGNLLTQEEVFTRAGRVEQAEDVEQRGFAAARGTHHRDELPRLDRQVHLVQGGGFDVLGGVDFFQVPCFDHVGLLCAG